MSSKGVTRLSYVLNDLLLRFLVLRQNTVALSGCAMCELQKEMEKTRAF